MAYNLNVFEIFVVSIPRTGRMVFFLSCIGLIGGILTAGAIAVSPYDSGPGLAVFLAIGVFGLPSFAGGEAVNQLVPSYPRNWGYYLASVSMVLAIVLLPIAFLFGGSWNLLWLAIGISFLNNFQVLTVSDGLGRYPLVGIASAVQPALMAVGLSVTVPNLAQPPVTHAPAVAVLLTVGLGLGIVSLFVEWLLDANITEVDGLEITSNLVQRTDLHLGMGFETEPTVQTFAVETKAGQTTVVAPWIHPGVLEGIGGGRLTREIIREVSEDAENSYSTSDSGFFFHVPCSHLSDAADPTVSDTVLQSTTMPKTVGRASELISRTYDGTTFHGRRYGDDQVVYVESDHYGDFDIDVFGEVIDPEKTLLVDRHVRADDRDREFVYRDSAATDDLRTYLSDFLADLRSLPLTDYRAGHAADLNLDGDGISLFAIVEEVGEQRTVLLGADQNEEPQPLVNLRDELDERYDEVVLFTTDTHASVYSERFDPQVDADRVRSVVETARATVSDAVAGVTSSHAPEVPLLRTDYLRLMHSLNITARIYILLLAGLYVVLVAGLLAL